MDILFNIPETLYKKLFVFIYNLLLKLLAEMEHKITK